MTPLGRDVNSASRKIQVLAIRKSRTHSEQIFIPTTLMQVV